MEPLQELQKNWSNPETPVSFSILLQCTNRILSDAAKASNKYVDLSKKTRVKKTCIPAEVTAAAKAKKVAHTILKNTPENALEGEKAVARVNFDNARKTYRNLWRRHLAATDNAQDSELHTILSTNPQAAHRVLNSAKSSGSTSISELKVANKVYRNDKTCDGFFENIQQLKTLDSSTKSCSSCNNFKLEYEMVKDICKAGQHIPLLDIEAAEKLLYSLRPNVCDHWSISASHYINGGPTGIKHFQLIMNTAISDIENTTCDEFNTAHAQVLYKGHQKDNTFASSYRTISSCPFVAKGLDTYIRDLSLN